MLTTRIGRITAVLALFILFNQIALAVAPTPEAVEKWRAEGVLEQKLANLRAFKEAGGCAPMTVYSPEAFRAKAATSANTTDTLRIIVLLVDFSDWPYNGTTDQSQAATADIFDSILFSDKRLGGRVNPSGSMTDYYWEVSYGKLLVQGDVRGWFRMPETYAYYENGDDGLSRGSILALHAVNAADPTVDYTQYTGPNGSVAVVIIHAGRGAEEGAYGIWSHASSVAGVPSRDGVLIENYTLNPEEYGSSITPIGVFCHEFGHTLGLPDLYDTDYTPASSNGLGGWSLMSSGNYNGGSKYPAHMDPWCKRRLLYIDSFIAVTQNLNSVEIPAVEYNPVVYQIPYTTPDGPEYWLVENRQKYGSDEGLMGEGLLIYHIDELAPGYNNNYLRYRVALEQADGLNALALGGSRGDGGDPWPGQYNKREFHDLTTPNSRTNVDTAVTQTGVWEISDSDSLMYADLDVTYSRPYFLLYGIDSLVWADTVDGGDGDEIIEQGETVDFYIRVKNLMRNAYNFDVSLSTDNPDIEFITNGVAQGSLTIPSTLINGQRSTIPVRFRMKPEAKGTISQFTATIRADSAAMSGDRKFEASWTFDVMLGAPEILVVDDDAGQNNQGVYTNTFYSMKVPYSVWEKQTLGSPSAAALQRYKSVFWCQGNKPGGVLTADDVAALKGFLDNGGNLALGSASAAAQLHVLDSAFMRDYLHARFADSLSSAYYFAGLAGNPVAGNFRWRYYTWASNAIKRVAKLEPADGGQLAFEVDDFYVPGNYRGHCGVTYQGTYKTVFMTFALEYISDRDTLTGFAHRDTIFTRILDFFGGSSTSVDDNKPGTLPETFTLQQNYPNPFNPSTTISYSISPISGSKGRVATTLSIYNLVGQKVRTLLDKIQGPGDYTVEWDGADDSGGKVASGIYLYRLSRGDRAESKKMVLLK